MIEKQKRTAAHFQRALISFVSVAVVFGGLVAITPFIPKEHRREDVLALVGAAMLLQMGVIMAIVHVTRPQDAPQRGQPLSQVLNFVLGSVSLLMPIFGPIWFAPEIVYGAFLVVFVVSSWTTWRTWRGADELMKRMLTDACVLNYMITSSAVCLYATGERLGLFGGVSLWVVLGIMTLTNMGASFYVIFRHGQHKFPPEE